MLGGLVTPEVVSIVERMHLGEKVQTFGCPLHSAFKDHNNTSEDNRAQVTIAPWDYELYLPTA